MRSRRRVIRAVLTTVALLGTSFAGAQSPAPPSPAALPAAAAAEGDAATHDALRGLRKRIVEAFNARNVDALVAEAHPDIVFTTMNNDVAHGREGVRAYFQKMMVGPERAVDDIKIDFEPEALTALYGDAGVSYGASEGHYKLRGGTEIDIHARWTATLAKDQGAWKVAAFHYSTNVFDNPILDRVKRLAMLGAAAAVLAGVAIGFLVGRRRRTG